MVMVVCLLRYFRHMKLSKKILPVIISLLALNATSFFSAQEGHRGLASCDEVNTPSSLDVSASELLSISAYFDDHPIVPDEKLVAKYYDQLTQAQYAYLSMNQSIRDAYGLKTPKFGADYGNLSLTPSVFYAHTSQTWQNYIGNPVVDKLFSGPVTSSGVVSPISLVQTQSVIPNLNVGSLVRVPNNPKPLF